MKKNLVLLAIVVTGCFAASCSKKENKYSNVSNENTQPYTIQIAPVQQGASLPEGISFGSYGTLKATVINDLTSTEIENPDIIWSTNWNGAAFDAPSSTITVFRAPSTESAAGTTRKITVTYKDFSKDHNFIGGNVNAVSANDSCWYAGNNDNNIIDGNIEISHIPDELDHGVATTYTVDVYHNGVIDSSEDCSQAVWTFTGSAFTEISGTTGKSVTATIKSGAVMSINVVLRGRSFTIGVSR
ncbi:MAG: hypothetical protein LBL00_05305 [Endomicrobium sp.]|jgi:hypothetical protein|nr:hypothetical protein [Endomicrobium sp.]